MRVIVTICVCTLAAVCVSRQFTQKPVPYPQTPRSIVFEIDGNQSHPISPLIYGMAHANPDVVRDLRLGLNRWGGNANSRYNWEINAWNHARDWQWSNYGENSAIANIPGAVVDGFVKSNGPQTLSYLTMPTIGWVAKDREDSSRSINVPSGGLGIGSAHGAIAGYSPAENRTRTSIPSFPRKGKSFAYPPSLTDNAVYQDEWVDHLRKQFQAGGPDQRQYMLAMDNEPDIWDVTHTDIHPGQMGYDELLSTFLEYATAAKDVDSRIKIGGPVSWGWTGYFHSPKDRDNYGSRPDRRAHNDVPFIPWFLRNVKLHDDRTKSRSLDVLDIHYYPQAKDVYSKSIDPNVSAIRLRSTRSLWDKTYVDESWIGEPIMLIPRLKEWISQEYPRTQLGLMEWNWGAEQDLTGALAIADCLGIFGREGLDMAAYWTAPPRGSPGYFAFKMFRNADGLGHGFGDTSLAVNPRDGGEIACYASTDAGKPVIILVNKSPHQSVSVKLKLINTAAVSRANIWQYGADANQSIHNLAPQNVSRAELTVQSPPYTVTLIRCQ